MPDVSHVEHFNLVREDSATLIDMPPDLFKYVTMINVIILYAYAVIYLFN